MTLLRQGDSGAGVEALQLKLKAAGYDPGDVDSQFGRRTLAAVLAFQADRPDIDDDGIAGPMTMGALDAAIAKRRASSILSSPLAPVPCADSTWQAFEHLVDAVTQRPVRYGPGRGLFVGGKFVVTHGPGALGLKGWKNAIGRSYASFHCTSWVNFFLGWLLRRNQDYTHAGNVPSLFDLLENDASVHTQPGASPYRGYGDACVSIAPDGSGIKRTGVPKTMDARELLARRFALPTFVACGQSTRRWTGWVWWHHVVLFVVDHRNGSRLYRIAADGSKGVAGYSGQPMRYVEVTEKNVDAFAGVVYRAYGVKTIDGTYGPTDRPIAPVTFED